MAKHLFAQTISDGVLARVGGPSEAGQETRGLIFTLACFLTAIGKI